MQKRKQNKQEKRSNCQSSQRKERISFEIIFNNFSENGQELRVWGLPRFNHRLHATQPSYNLLLLLLHTRLSKDDRDSHITTPKPQTPNHQPLGGFLGVVLSLSCSTALIRATCSLQPAIRRLHSSKPI